MASDEKLICNLMDRIKKDPIFMVSVIETIMDPKNPDSQMIRKEIIKVLSDELLRDEKYIEDIKETIKNNINVVIDNLLLSIFTQNEDYVKQKINESITAKFNDFINSKMDFMKKLFDDYFSNLKNLVENKLNDAEKETSDKIRKDDSEIDNKNCQLVSIPDSIKEDVQKYIDFLKFKK